MAATNVTALCDGLLNGVCNTYSTIWPAASVGTFTIAQCVGFFNGLATATVGTPADTSGNTLGCRQHYLNLVNASDSTTFYNCRFAGFSGGGICGAPLANTCDAVNTLCSANPNYPYTGGVTQCKTDLTGLQLVWGSNTGAAGGAENSLECRIYHALVGQFAAVHCGHVNSTGPCLSPGTVAPNADHYCGTIQYTCTGTNTQYNTQSQCLTSFATFPVGPGVSATVNTANDQSSRQYHTQAANILSATTHCPHGGPSGGGVVGTSRQAWGSLAGCAACVTATPYLKTSVQLAVNNWTAADLDAIFPPDPNLTTYTVAAQNPGLNNNTDTCRLYHLTVGCNGGALNVHCAHGDLLGGGQCPLANPVVPACNIINRACPTAFAAGACQTAVGGYLAANKTGDPNNALPTDDSVACRLYWSVSGLVAKAAGGSATCANVAFTGNKACGQGSSDATRVTVPAFVAALLMMLW